MPTTNPFKISNSPFYDVFHCRGHYLGIVAPFYSRPALANHFFMINDQPAEWFTLYDHRQFTLSLLIRIPRPLRADQSWQLTIHKLPSKNVVHTCLVPRTISASGFLSMATLVRFDSAYLAEWVSHGQYVGIEHFYVYNHTSVADITNVLKPYRDIVTEIPWIGPYELGCAMEEPFLNADNHIYTQGPQMMHAALKYGDGWDWMGFFDADEFLCPLNRQKVSTILRFWESESRADIPFTRTASIQVQGKWFGPEHDHNRTVMASYRHCEPGHTCGTKCFVQPSTVRSTSIHYWDVEGSQVLMPDNVLRFNHYRSISPFKKRIDPNKHAYYCSERNTQIMKLGLRTP